MTDFEQWIQTTPEYKNLLIQHGERLFIMRDGEYEILTVRLAHRAWSNSRQLSKDEYIALTQEWHTKGFEAAKQVIRECEHLWIIVGALIKSKDGFEAIDHYQCFFCGERKNHQ